MRRAAITAVVLGALALPAIALAVTAPYGGPIDQGARGSHVKYTGGGAQVYVGFRAVWEGGKVVAVKKFKYRDAPLKCEEPTGAAVSGRAPKMKVRHKEFHGDFTDHGEETHVDGAFHRHGTQASGTLRLKGDFESDDGTMTYHNCDSSRLDWTVSQS